MKNINRHESYHNSYILKNNSIDVRSKKKMSNDRKKYSVVKGLDPKADWMFYGPWGVFEKYAENPIILLWAALVIISSFLYLFLNKDIFDVLLGIIGIGVGVYIVLQFFRKRKTSAQRSS